MSIFRIIRKKAIAMQQLRLSKKSFYRKQNRKYVKGRSIRFCNLTKKTARETSSFSCGCLLSAKLNSTVPTYTDEFNLAKYNFLFRPLPVCRQFVDTQKAVASQQLLFFTSMILTLRRFPSGMQQMHRLKLRELHRTPFHM